MEVQADRSAMLLYRSSNSNEWHLVCEMPSERVYVLQRANSSSGSRETPIEVGAFLSLGNGPEQQALLSLIGTLVF